MKALIIADRRPDEPLELTLAREQPEIVVTLGDLYSHDLAALRDYTGPKLGVYGNHCTLGYMARLGIENLHLRRLQVGGLVFGGMEGCVRYKPQGGFQYTQTEADRMLAGFLPVDVMVCHCPPYGINDDPNDPAHVGFHALRRYLDNRSPAVLLHGHIYPRAPATTADRTRIVYVSGSAVIELP
jgi:Icc-related predicted phosphoesterase